jgi:phosphoglycolate phosphatase-like HAD superfamily hydrolase
VIFDIDGTLVDSFPTLFRTQYHPKSISWSLSLKHFGVLLQKWWQGNTKLFILFEELFVRPSRYTLDLFLNGVEG